MATSKDRKRAELTSPPKKSADPKWFREDLNSSINSYTGMDSVISAEEKQSIAEVVQEAINAVLPEHPVADQTTTTMQNSATRMSTSQNQNQQGSASIDAIVTSVLRQLCPILVFCYYISSGILDRETVERGYD